MKNTFQIIILLTYYLSSYTQAQELKVKSISSDEWTNELSQGYWTKALGQNETGYYLLREYGPISSQNIILEKYSPDLKLIFSTSIESTSGTIQHAKLHRYTEMAAGRVFIFLEEWNKGKGKNGLLIKEILSDGNIAKNEIVLETEPADSQSKSSNYLIKFSPDGSKLLVLVEKPYVKDSKESLRLSVFDTKDFSISWSQNITLTNIVEKGRNNDMVVDNDGNAYLFKTIYLKDKKYQYQLLTANSNEYRIKEIDLKEYAPNQKKIMINHSGQFQIGAMLGPAFNKSTDWQATWFFQANAQGEILQNKIVTLGEELLSNLIDKKSAQKENYKLSDFILKDILLKSDNGMLLLTEHQRTRTTPIVGSMPPMYQYEMNNGNAVVISFTKDGDRNWNTILVKDQHSITTDIKHSYNSYAYQLIYDQLYILWNYTDLKINPPVINYRYWIDINGQRINIDNLYGNKTIYPTLLTVIDKDGYFVHDKRTFKSLPVVDLQKRNSFDMAMNPSIFFPTSSGIILLSHMSHIEAFRYKFSKLTYY